MTWNNHRNRGYKYWPRLVAGPAVGLALFVAFSALGPPAVAALPKVSPTPAVQQLLRLTNKQRQNHHEASLILSDDLESAAAAKAQDMIAGNYWAHTSPSGKTPWDFIRSSGYRYSAAGENLAYGFNSLEDVVAAWMASPDHRANILDGTYKAIGLTVVHANSYQGGSATIVVAEFAAPASSSHLAGLGRLAMAAKHGVATSLSAGRVFVHFSP